jgi:hypothetical protein
LKRERQAEYGGEVGERRAGTATISDKSSPEIHAVGYGSKSKI